MPPEGAQHDLCRRRRTLRRMSLPPHRDGAASTCRRSRSASGRISAASTSTRSAAPCCAAPSTAASPISTSPTITARPTARRRRISAASSPPISAPYRDELVISTKAGWDMWPGPYGDLGSRKYLVASLDQSLQRMGLDYVDIFYHHRPDPDTPLEETMGALDHHRPPGQGALCRHLPVPAGGDPRGGRDPQGDGHAAAHPPAELLDAQPLDRGRPARRARRARRRLHLLLAAGAGAAHQQISQRRAGRTPARRANWTLQSSRITPELVDKLNRLAAIAETPRPDAGPAGARLGASRRPASPRR